MKFFKSMSLGLTAAALVAAVSLTAVAADSVPAEKVRPAAVKMQKVELTDEQKAELTENAKAALDEKLASGELTQEQYDEILAKIESGDLRGFGGKRHGLYPKPDAELPEGAVKAEKVQKPELTDEQKAELTENAKATLDEKLASGELTQEQYDEILAKIESGDLRGFGGKRHGLYPKPDAELPEGAVKAEKVQKPELTDEQKAELTENAKATLDEKLASGELTQEQYDEILAKIESGDLRGFGGKRHGMAPGRHGQCPDMAADESEAV